MSIDRPVERPSAGQDPFPASVPRIASFDPAEYQARLRRIRAGIRERGLDALLLLDSSNVFYLAGIDSQGAGHLQCLVVGLDDDPLLVTWDFERGAALMTGWIESIVTYGWFEDPMERLAETVAGLGLSSGRLGIELGARALTAGRFGALQRQLPAARLEDGYGIVEAARLTKSAAELDHIRAAAAITDAAVEAAATVIAPGRRDTDVAAEIARSVYAAGSETVCWGPIVASGYGAGLMHTSFHGRTLEPGDTVFIELSGQVHHYVAPVMRTFVLGRPTSDIVAFRDAGLAALSAVIETARPGVPAGEVARAAAARLAPIADRVLFHDLFGYSVGIGFAPSWYETLGFELREGNDRPLVEGMVFHVPLSLRRFGEFGICQSQTIVIGPDGAEPLTRTPAELRILA
jgi:Xaa-Pro dipeptidase